MVKKLTEHQQTVIYKMNGHAIFNEKTGRLRYHDAGNDVFAAICDLGGVESAAKLFNATTQEVDFWIDEYYVPNIYAEQIHRSTGYSISSLQQPPRYVIVDGIYWPKSGFMTEMNFLALDLKINTA